MGLWNISHHIIIFKILKLIAEPVEQLKKYPLEKNFFKVKLENIIKVLK